MDQQNIEISEQISLPSTQPPQLIVNKIDISNIALKNPKKNKSNQSFLKMFFWGTENQVCKNIKNSKDIRDEYFKIMEDCSFKS